MSSTSPPRWLERLLERALPHGLSGQGALGDLTEEYRRRAEQSRIRAFLWYGSQTASVVGYRLFTGSGADSPAGRSTLTMDFRWAIRSALKHPGFSFSVIALLGLGLGAIAGVFSVVDGTLRQTDAWDKPDATVAIWPDRPFSFGILEMYRDEQTVYQALGGYAELAFAVAMPGGESESVNGVLITPELFRELAVQPVLGRALSDGDAALGGEAVAVIGEAFWRRSFGADPSIVGSRVDISGSPVTVVGVQGAGGMVPEGRSEVWLPLVMDPRDDDYFKAQSFNMMGVLRVGATLDDAFDDLVAYTERLSRLFPMFYPVGFAEGIASVARADDAQRRLISTPLLLLLAGTALLMLASALNVGSLLLGRAISRRRELSVRVSLGATRGRIVRQLLVEGLVLTVLALVVGLACGSWGGRWIAGLFVGEAAVANSAVLSSSVLMFMVAVAALSWLVLNGVPIAFFLRTPRSGMHMGHLSGIRLQRSLVTVQAALATLLLVSAALLVATVGNLRDVSLGFEPAGLTAVELSPPADRIEDIATARALYDRLVERVESLPGVSAAGLTGWLPLRAQAPATPVNLEVAPVDPAQAPLVPKHMVDPGFFETLGISPSAGRLLGSEDRTAEANAVVVNETLAAMLWPGTAPIGQLIAIDPHEWDRWVPVVGVVPDVRSGEMIGPIEPALYVALAESPARDVTLLVRSEGGSSALAPMLRRAIGEVDRLVPIRDVSPMSDVLKAAYATSWVVMGFLIVLALLATGLGAMGIYAVLAHHVALNKRDIGVRMALGAQPRAVVGGVVRSGMFLTGAGVLIGSGAALASTRYLESLLFEVSTLAPWAFAAAALPLMAASTLAAWVPAARAGRLPPAEVLRSD